MPGVVLGLLLTLLGLMSILWLTFFLVLGLGVFSLLMVNWVWFLVSIALLLGLPLGVVSVSVVT